MGLSFHYSGVIANPQLLPELIEEVRDIAGTYNWKFNVFDQEFPDNCCGKDHYNQNIYGISFTPPGCETIPICFLSNGRMSSLPHLMFFGKTEDQPESDSLYMLSVKTQYADVETHQLIIKIFRHLKEKYLTDFKLTDEGKYWETNDLELLRINFEKNLAIINSFFSALETIPMLPNESIEDYFARMLKFIKDSKGM
jgi:hypothetical protein